jgi:glucose/arabinose dehydrogenase
MIRLLILSVLIGLLVGCGKVSQQSVQYDNKFMEVLPKGTFEAPVGIKHAEDGSGRLFVVEKAGRIVMLQPDGDTYKKSIFLNITAKVNDEKTDQGLLGLAFHPDYRDNDTFYVNYTSNKNKTVIASYRVKKNNPNLADVRSEKVILTIDQPFNKQTVSDIAFGADEFLYIATGDGGESGDPKGNSQNLRSLLGKILRIDVRPEDRNIAYRIPYDNPYINQTAYAREEIYAYGLRNPWRMSFDRATGELWAADIGQNNREEINLVEKGENYGWNVMEGSECFGSKAGCESVAFIDPVFEYEHGAKGATVTGGYVYRGVQVPDFHGKYVFADFFDGRIWTLEKTNSKSYVTTLHNERIPGIRSFGEDENWELFAVTDDGALRKLQQEEVQTE